MNWVFPEIKTTRTLNEQFLKIIDECKEYQEASSEKEKDEEIIDILHSIETLLRLRFKNREDELDKIIKSTIYKNLKRCYYENSCY